MSEMVPETARRAARAASHPPASPRRVPARPIARPSAAKAAKTAPREAPRARSVAISGRRRTTEIETALAIRKNPTRIVSDPSAFRLNRKARTIRSAVAAERVGGSIARPGGRREASCIRTASLETSRSRTTSTRSA